MDDRKSQGLRFDGTNMTKLNVPVSSYFTTVGAGYLKTYLGKVVRGNDHVFTAPFAKGHDIHEVIDEWLTTLTNRLKDDWPSLVSFENDLASKVGPLSVQKPLEDRYADIENYYTMVQSSSELAPMDADAIEAVCREFRAARGLRLYSEDYTVSQMKKSTNSGSPFFTKRRNLVRDTIPFLVDVSNRYKLPRVHYPHCTYDAAAVIGWRGQEGGPDIDDVKQRVVWMFPFAINIAELQLYQPFIASCQRHGLVPAWVSMDAVDKEITKLFDSKRSEDYVVCTDFTKFDQHYNRAMQDVSETILRYMFIENDYTEEWFSEIFPIKYNIPLVTRYIGNNKIEVYFGFHGMGSGSGGTNPDETCGHRYLQHHAAISRGEILNPHSQCLGDDGCLSFRDINVDDVIEAYQSHGLEMNPSKQYVSRQDCVYLRRWHHTNYRVQGICAGVYSTCRALGRLRFLERYMDPEYWSPKMVALRQLSIIENCKWHPLFHEFIEFCMKRDDYRLGLDIPGFLDNIVIEAQKATDYMPDFLGYTKTLQGEGPDGIADWEVVKYLKSK
jgi:hypothetical protein